MPLRSKINCLYIIGTGENAIQKEGKAAFVDYLTSEEGEPLMDRVLKGFPREKAPIITKGVTGLTTTPIFRHGESEANEDNIKSTPETPLTAKGVEEAKTLGEKLKKDGVNTIYHSDYVRSRQTADEAASVSGAKTELLPNSEEKRSDETDEEFIKRVADLKKKISELPSHSAVISHGLVMKAMQALDETNGNEAEAAKIYRKLPFVKNTEQLKTGGQDAIQNSTTPKFYGLKKWYDNKYKDDPDMTSNGAKPSQNLPYDPELFMKDAKNNASLRALPIYKDIQQFLKEQGGQDAIQKQEPDEGVLGNEGIQPQSELPRVGEGNEEHQTAAPSRTADEETPKEIEVLPEKPTFSTPSEKQTSPDKIEDIPEGKDLTGQVVVKGKQTFHVVNDGGGTTIKAIPLEGDNDTYAGSARVIKRSDLDGYMPNLSTQFNIRLSPSLNDKIGNDNAMHVATLVHRTLPNLKDVFILDKVDFKQALKDVAGFSEGHLMVNKDIQPISRKLGEISGFVNGSQMYLDAKDFGSNVVMHEGSHLFLKWAKNNASHIYNEGLKLMDGTPYMMEVLHNPFYINRANKLIEGGMTHYEALNELRDEALALAVGDKGKRMAEHIKPPFIRWLNGLWGSVKNYFGYGKPAIEKMSPDQISNMTYGQFADAISSRLLSGRRLEGKAASGSPSFSVRGAPDFDRIWDAALDRAKSENIDTKDIEGVMRYIRDYFKTTTGNSYDHDMLFDRLRDMNRKTKANIPVSHLKEIAQDENNPVSNEPYSGDSGDKMTLEEKAALAANTLRKSRKAPKAFKETAFAKTARQAYNTFDNIHGEEGKVTKTLMDNALGKMNALQLKHYQLLEKMKRDFYGMPEKDRILFISRMRSGEGQSTQKLDDYAYTLNGIFDEAFKGLSKISDINMLDNYFPQFWKRPDDYSRFVEAHRKNNAPIEGSADFLKERMINDLADGINAGLVPVSTNPAILAQLYLRNSAKYQMAHALLSDLIRKGLAVPSVDGIYNSITGEKIPASFEEGGYSIFKNFARQYYKMEAKAGRGEKTITTRTGDVTIKPYGGKIYVPPETNEALGSIFGKGLMNTNFDNIFRAVGNMGNHLNFMQLALSGYHMLTTTGNFIGTHMGMSISELLAGKFGSAAVDLGKAIAFPYSIAKAFGHYQDLIKSNDAGMYNDPALKMLIEAGGRLRPDPIYRDNWRNTLLKNYSELKNGDETNKMWGTAKVLGDSFMATMTSATDAIMEHWVPVLKMQAFTDLAKSELMLMKPATDMERMQLLQDAYTHIENRFGEMDYNRLFMNRAIKEGSFLMFRASGWTIGVMKEGAGALMGGMVKSIKRLGKGQGLNPDTAFLLGLIATNAAACGIYNQIRWGNLTGWRDMIGYRTGNINKDGTPEYRMPLAFMREWYAYGKNIPTFVEHGEMRSAINATVGNFSTEMSNKISPAISFMQEIIKNKDYFGDPIFSHHDFLSDNDKENYIQRVMDSKIGDGIKFLSSNIIPISFRGENNSDNPLNAEYWSGFFSGSGALQRSGITRAPMDFDRQTWQNVIMDKYYKTTGSTDFTFNRKYINLYNNILKGIANIHTGDETKNGLILNGLISAGQQDGVLKPYQNLDYFIKKYQNYYPNHFAALNPSDMLDIIGSGLIPASEVPSLLTGYSSEKRGTVKSILDKYAKEHADVIAATSKYKRAMQIVDNGSE